MSGWNQNSVEKVKSLLADGYSASMIAGRVGKSRSAICGLVYRLREKGEIKPAEKQVRFSGCKGGHSANQPRVRAPVSRGYGPKKGTVYGRRDVFGVGTGIGKLRASPVPLPRENDIARVSFADLERHHCRFICCAEAGKAVAAGDKLYCGNPIVPGTSWCEGHLARVAPAAKVAVLRLWAPAIEPAEEMPA